MAERQVRSKLVSLNDLTNPQIFEGLNIKNPRFRVPIYQRLYVWGGEQVRALLEDIKTAYKKTAYKEDKNKIYYIGPSVLIEEKDKNDQWHLDIIDGQQRLTTLWMMCAVLNCKLNNNPQKEAQECLQSFLQITENAEGKKKNSPRLTFAIREDANNYLNEMLVSDNVSENTSGGKVPKIAEAMDVIKSHYDEHFEDGEYNKINDLARFIMNKVIMAMTIVPERTDLNKLFELINNRGLQLQHHEILKGQMFKHLKDDEDRKRYSILWDSCANMNSYIEHNLQSLVNYTNVDSSGEPGKQNGDETAKNKVAELTRNINIDELYTKDEEPLGNAREVINQLPKTEPQEKDRQIGKCLKNILDNPPCNDSNAEEKKSNSSNISDENDDVKSICNFSVLLQHTLRIWLNLEKRLDISGINDQKLIEIFKEHFLESKEGQVTGDDVKSFIELLWEVRYIFDKYIVKWVGDSDNDKTLLIRKLTKDENEKSLQRDSDEVTQFEGFAQLQRMLYHSQEIKAIHWLTPLIEYIRNTKKGGLQQHYKYLRRLDNQLFCTNDSEDMVERTYKYLKEPLTYNEPNCDILRHQSNIGHYWFYKLEFILWYKFNKNDDVQCNGLKVLSKDIRNINKLLKEYRIKAKSSLEHICPQDLSKWDDVQFDKEQLNKFGNLALLSKSSNSGYSNLSFDEKRSRFIRLNKERLESLKLAYVYNNKSWEPDTVKKHEDEMIEEFVSYFKECKEECSVSVQRG